MQAADPTSKVMVVLIEGFPARNLRTKPINKASCSNDGERIVEINADRVVQMVAQILPRSPIFSTLITAQVHEEQFYVWTGINDMVLSILT